MHSDGSAILEALLVASSRLTRLAAQETGNRTPSAVWRTLGILDAEGPMRVGALATAARVTQPGMTRVLGHMVEEGLVSRIADTSDSRAWLIAVTPKGATALREWRTQIGDALLPYFHDLDEVDWHALHRAAELMAARTAAGMEKAS